MTQEIKPCPFCAYEEATPFHNKAEDSCYVICGACNGRSPNTDTLNHAIGAWNKRVNENESLHARIKELEEALAGAIAIGSRMYNLDEERKVLTKELNNDK